MQSSNILDQTEYNRQNKCPKTTYLLQTNQLLTLQLSSLSALLHRYKSVEFLLEQRNKQQQQISNQFNSTDKLLSTVQSILGEIQNDMQLCINGCESICQPSCDCSQLEVQEQFCSQLLASYQATLSELKNSIKYREIMLQQLQNNHKQLKKQGARITQNHSTISLIESLDIYPCITKKCNKQIQTLRKLKQKETEKLQQEQTQKKQKQQQHKNQQKRISKNQGQNLCQFIPVETLSSKNKNKVSLDNFWKMLAIYKKKRIFNDMMQARVLKLKSTVRQKQISNRLCNPLLHTEVWSHIQNERDSLDLFFDNGNSFLSQSQSFKVNEPFATSDLSTFIQTLSNQLQNQFHAESKIQNK